MNAGDLSEKLAFGERTASGDDFGGTEGDFVEAFQRSAQVVPKLGGEEVFAARRTGIQPVRITVRADAQTRLISSNWRGVVVSGRLPIGTVFDVKSFFDPYAGRPDAGQWIEFLAEMGTGQA